MKRIEMTIECPECQGTGIYVGMSESEGTGVVCNCCKGTGAYKYSYYYREFTGKRRKRDDVKRVYLHSMGYKIGLGKINFTGVGKIDMDKEGVSYQEFLDGEMPTHTKKLGCPMLADQYACHKIDGFVDKCGELGLSWGDFISQCKYQSHKDLCWERFEAGQRKEGGLNESL